MAWSETSPKTVGLNKRARWVGNRYLRKASGRAALDGGQPGERRKQGVPHHSLHGIFHSGEAHELVGESEHVGRDGDALVAVGVEEAVRSAAVGDEGQLPRQVVRVHHAGVQTLTAGR